MGGAMNRKADIINMKMSRILLMAAAAWLAAGCKNPVNLSGSHATPAQEIGGRLNVTSNSVSVGK
jgi:hypothetical protein